MKGLDWGRSRHSAAAMPAATTSLSSVPKMDPDWLNNLIGARLRT